jgi:hypothetical protein
MRHFIALWPQVAISAVGREKPDGGPAAATSNPAKQYVRLALAQRFKINKQKKLLEKRPYRPYN